MANGKTAKMPSLHHAAPRAMPTAEFGRIMVSYFQTTELSANLQWHAASMLRHFASAKVFSNAFRSASSSMLDHGDNHVSVISNRTDSVFLWRDTMSRSSVCGFGKFGRSNGYGNAENRGSSFRCAIDESARIKLVACRDKNCAVGDSKDFSARCLQSVDRCLQGVIGQIQIFCISLGKNTLRPHAPGRQSIGSAKYGLIICRSIAARHDLNAQLHVRDQRNQVFQRRPRNIWSQNLATNCNEVGEFILRCSTMAGLTPTLAAKRSTTSSR